MLRETSEKKTWRTLVEISEKKNAGRVPGEVLGYILEYRAFLEEFLEQVLETIHMKIPEELPENCFWRIFMETFGRIIEGTLYGIAATVLPRTIL